MKRVYQTKFGDEGNCLQAALASILEVDLADVPNLADSPFWLEAIRFFAEDHNYVMSVFPDDPPLRPNTYYVEWGLSPRGNQHAVVGYNSEIVHDPHPDGGGLLRTEGYIAFRKREPQGATT